MTNAARGMYAPGRLRDEFLKALDDHDAALSHRLARQLIACGNPLPGMACDQLDLPRHSTYACAARLLLDGASAWHVSPAVAGNTN